MVTLNIILSSFTDWLRWRSLFLKISFITVDFQRKTNKPRQLLAESTNLQVLNEKWDATVAKIYCTSEHKFNQRKRVRGSDVRELGELRRYTCITDFSKTSDQREDD